MKNVIFLALILVFFGLTWAFVKLCELRELQVDLAHRRVTLAGGE